MDVWKKESIQNVLELIMKGIEEQYKELEENIGGLLCHNNGYKVQMGISKIKFLVEILEENFNKYVELKNEELKNIKEEPEWNETDEEDEIDDIPF